MLSTDWAHRDIVFEGRDIALPRKTIHDLPFTNDAIAKRPCGYREHHAQTERLRL
jgi:hypothetical protein